jgi:hypothetical protein
MRVGVLLMAQGGARGITGSARSFEDAEAGLNRRTQADRRGSGGARRSMRDDNIGMSCHPKIPKSSVQ